MTFDEQVKKRGFASEKEYREMIARLPTAIPASRIEAWRDRNGTKAELERIALGEVEL